MSKLCKDCACENVCGITHLPEDKACGFYYKADAITELEKIKTDLEKLSKNEWNKQVGADKGLELAIDVVEDRISELKGGNANSENEIYCDRNICLQNEYNNIGCDNCVVKKGGS